MKRVAVVGAGIAGLTAAYRLGVLASAQAASPFQVDVLEASERPGGVINTLSREGFLLEGGPDSFLNLKPAAQALAEELKIASWLIPTRSAQRRSFLLRKGRLIPVPEGFYLLAPSSLAALWRSGLFSLPGKLRMSLEPLIPARRSETDESLASFVRRRLGREALERFAGPMASAITSADPERVSLQASLPQFAHMEREYGSLIRALREKALRPGTSGPRYGLFLTFRDGMQTLVDTLVNRLPPASMRLSSPVQALTRPTEGGVWRIHLTGGRILEAQGLCLALPGWASANLLRPIDPGLAGLLDALPYGDAATVSFGFHREQVGHPLDGMGFVVPKAEGLSLLSCSFSSTKFPGRAPEGTVLVRAFAGGAPDPERLLSELRGILGIQGDPLLVHAAWHPRSLAQYPVGHLQNLERIEEHLKGLPGLALAGSCLRGVGIPDCIASGEAAASALAGRLQG